MKNKRYIQMTKSKKDKARWDRSDAFDPQYDSDEDLTSEERETIKNSPIPSKTRNELWDKKDIWSKTKKLMKSSWYGDKRSKK